jgi:mono/diheme cytochrome c family protein
MLFSRMFYWLLLLFIIISSTACTHIGINESNSPFINRYTEYMLGKLPKQYEDLKNPLSASKENINAGKNLYQIQCVRCHGALGKGNGPIGELLTPQPANLTLTRRLPIATDKFLFWTLSEGGQRFNTAMPAFGQQLSDQEIWQLSLYINSGFTI